MNVVLPWQFWIEFPVYILHLTHNKIITCQSHFKNPRYYNKFWNQAYVIMFSFFMFMHRDIISGFHTKGSKSAGRGQGIRIQNLFSRLPQMRNFLLKKKELQNLYNIFKPNTWSLVKNQAIWPFMRAKIYRVYPNASFPLRPWSWQQQCLSET